ncbi:saccharopine dehydrogenase-like NADP-dependent oxidoreductase [Paenibacillus amylolyticus]|uniref:Saccharopine dehydrogenase-like NADP-dependent oxidoreductase n=1 Tax=Paenibacillus amylolyticus TaxID=1451 RepID=A0AAP5H004_PAEAM|nr:saccharopine dehydrogenase NADP-binding domain-containing protein [Paenibacillus amylolyticus]MDR6723804.1 saccharopine dehydrogenase-like NADP-dependent oxidoreductase [Paenibacillus amylolyticus]
MQDASKVEMVKDQIWVVGGYGQVGQMICIQLGQAFPGKVWAVGPRLNRAEEFSRSTNGAVLPLQIDVRKHIDPVMLATVKLVVMCVDQMHTHFVEACAEAGTDYMDITAKYDFLAQVERLHEHMQAKQATAMLSVGLSPGVTNLLVHEAVDGMDQTDDVNITVMLGLGEKHGKAAVEWTVDQMNTTYQVTQKGEYAEVDSFDDGRWVDFGEQLGRRKAYRFNFSDQHVVARTLQIPTVSTRLCLDSRWITRAMSLAKRVGIFRLLRISSIRNATVKAFGLIPGGEEMYAVKVDAKGWTNGKPIVMEQLIVGQREADVTAAVAAATAEKMYQEKLSPGVFHIEQVLSIQDIQRVLHTPLQITTRIS